LLSNQIFKMYFKGKKILLKQVLPFCLVLFISALGLKAQEAPKGTVTPRLYEYFGDTVYKDLTSLYSAMNAQEARAKHEADIYIEAEAIFNKAFIDIVWGHFTLADSLLGHLKQLLAENTDSVIFYKVVEMEGRYYWHIGDMEKSISAYLRANHFFKKRNDTLGQIRTYVGLSNSYKNINLTPKAKFYAKKAIGLALLQNKFLNTAYNAFASTYYKERKIDSAAFYFKKAIGVSDNSLIGNLRRAAIYNNMAVIYTYSNHFDSAKYYCNQAIQMSIPDKLIKIEGAALRNIGFVYFLQGDYDSAMEFCMQSDAVIKNHGFVNLKINLAYLKSKIYDRKGQFAQSLLQLKEYYHLKDSLAQFGQLQKISYWENQNAIEASRAERLLLQQTLIKEKTLRQKQVLYFLIVFLFFLVVIVFFLFRYISHKNQNKKLKAYNDMLEKKVGQHTQLLTKEIIKHDQIAKQLIIAQEKAIKADKLKSAFFANISHEVRTPLNAIAGFSDLLRMGGVKSSKKAVYLNQIIDNSDRLIHLVENIVELAKIETDQFHFRVGHFSIEQLTDNLLAKYGYLVREKGIEWNCQISQEVKGMVLEVDKDRLINVLSKLLSNAVYYTDDGSVFFAVIKRNGYIEFKVGDTGIGIPKEKQAQLFEKFVKVGGADYHFFNDSGVGLPLCNRLVNLMQGELVFESEVGKGTCFSVKIPFHS
jgi:signal transduction histidine kinase